VRRVRGPALFLCAQVRGGGFGFRVLRAYLVEAADERQAEQLALDAFPRPPAEFAATWDVLPLAAHNARPSSGGRVWEVPYDLYTGYRRWREAEGELPFRNAL